MKIKMLFTLSLMFLGMLSIKAQPPGGGVGVAVAADQTVKPHDDFAPCATIINFKQECDDQGNVTITFNVQNNTNLNVTSLWVYLDGPITITSIPVNLAPGGVSPTITYMVPSAPTIVCFNVRLFSKGEECCRIRRCFRIDECPCGEVEVDTITCVPGETDVYELCLTVTNPAYSTSIVDVIMMTSNYPDLCINNMPSPAPIVLSTPLAIGSTTTVCVTIEGCNSSIPDGEIIGITPHLLNSNTSYCCEPGAFRFRTPNCCDISSTATSTPAGCDDTGTVTINVAGGSPAFSLTGVGPGISFLGNSVTVNNLAPGTYNYTVTDSDGCVTTGMVVVGQVLPPPNCPAFNFTASSGNPVPPMPIISGVAATLTFTFNTASIPDSLNVLVNGATVLDSGNWSDSGSNGCGGIPGTGTFTGTINILPCDVVNIAVFGDVCGLTGTGWLLNVTCNTGPLPSSTVNALAAQAAAMESASSSESAKRLSQEATSSSLKVFPNPVQDVLTIQNTDTEVTYELVNILDSSGRIISTENMSGNADIRVDVSSLPRGMYFIDAMDSNGNKVTERFIKIK